MIANHVKRMIPWLFFLLLAGGCGGDEERHQDVGSFRVQADLSNVVAFASESPYREVLGGCISATREEEFCTMETLPLIGQQNGSPQIPDIMDRVAVSHAWMGIRFREVLEQLPSDIKTLMKAVTAIVIDDDVRPSFYSSTTGAIYLDPAVLWLTEEEKATISTRPDFRTHFGEELQFNSLWRYVKDNDYAYPSYSLAGSQDREAADLLYPLARLLYHELAHANDFFPPSQIEGLDRKKTVMAASGTLKQMRVATGLAESHPLASTVWSGLAQVLFQGKLATSEQKEYTPDFVGSEFEWDLASDDYGYSSLHEDVAMLFEETMMKFHFDVDRDIAFSPVPLADDPACDDHLVKWGVRNRIGASQVRQRGEFVAREILPGTDFGNFFELLPRPVPMIPDMGWCQNLGLGPSPSAVGPRGRDYRQQVRQDLLPPE